MSIDLLNRFVSQDVFFQILVAINVRKRYKIRVYRRSTDVEYQRIMTENRGDALTGKLGRNTDELRLRPSK